MSNPVRGRECCCVQLWKVRDTPLHNMIATIVLVGTIIAVFTVVHGNCCDPAIQYTIIPISVALFTLALMHVCACGMNGRSPAKPNDLHLTVRRVERRAIANSSPARIERQPSHISV